MRRNGLKYTLLLVLLQASYVAADEPPREFINSIGMKFRTIPAGTFMMGMFKSPPELIVPGDGPIYFENGYTDETPRHKIHITNSFYLGVTEVTQHHYEAVMGTNPSLHTKKGTLAEKVKGIDISNLPVENVSWEDAAEFCRKLSSQDGREYRLPTEAEWEYACRAGSRTRWYFGDDESELKEHAWYDVEWHERHMHFVFGAILQSRGHEVGDPPPPASIGPVAQKKPNSWGLYDMYGNVNEWCGDWYASSYYENSPRDDPNGPTSGSQHVTRGGGWDDPVLACRSSHRRGVHPTNRDSNLGFRVVLVSLSESTRAANSSPIRSGAPAEEAGGDE